MNLIDKLKEITDAIINVDEKIGFHKFVKYISLGLCVVIILNYKSVLKDVIEIVAEISNEIHNEKMQLRDELLAQLEPLLADFRSNVKADRILYFEYHNSNTNLVGIPFKYVELIQQNSGYGVPIALEERFKNINTGAITCLYEDIKLGNIVYCSGPGDNYFKAKYPGTYEIINSRDSAKRFIFISIPGINTPIGLIVLEWLSESTEELSLEEISNTAAHKYIPQINALILSKR